MERDFDWNPLVPVCPHDFPLLVGRRWAVFGQEDARLATLGTTTKSSTCRPVEVAMTVWMKNLGNDIYGREMTSMAYMKGSPRCGLTNLCTSCIDLFTSFFKTFQTRTGICAQVNKDANDECRVTLSCTTVAFCYAVSHIHHVMNLSNETSYTYSNCHFRVIFLCFGPFIGTNFEHQLVLLSVFIQHAAALLYFVKWYCLSFLFKEVE